MIGEQTLLLLIMIAFLTTYLSWSGWDSFVRGSNDYFINPIIGSVISITLFFYTALSASEVKVGLCCTQSYPGLQLLLGLFGAIMIVFLLAGILQMFTDNANMEL